MKIMTRWFPSLALCFAGLFGAIGKALAGLSEAALK